MDVAMCHKHKKRKENIYEQQNEADIGNTVGISFMKRMELRTRQPSAITSR